MSVPEAGAWAYPTDDGCVPPERVVPLTARFVPDFASVNAFPAVPANLSVTVMSLPVPWA